jgi:hypothetical protein
VDDPRLSSTRPACSCCSAPSYRDAAGDRLCRRGRGSVPVRGDDAGRRYRLDAPPAFARYLPFGALLAVVLLAELVFAVAAWNAGSIELAVKAAPVDPRVPNIQLLGNVLYTRYLYLFEGAGLVLLVAMIGAIVLTHRTRTGLRPQNVSRQNQRRPEDATRNVDPGVGQGVTL